MNKFLRYFTPLAILISQLLTCDDARYHLDRQNHCLSNESQEGSSSSAQNPVTWFRSCVKLYIQHQEGRTSAGWVVVRVEGGYSGVSGGVEGAVVEGWGGIELAGGPWVLGGTAGGWGMRATQIILVLTMKE